MQVNNVNIRLDEKFIHQNKEVQSNNGIEISTSTVP